MYYQEDGTIHGQCHSRSGIYSLAIELSPEGGWCVIRKDDRGSIQYIVCSETEDFDPMEIFEKSIFAQN